MTKLEASVICIAVIIFAVSACGTSDTTERTGTVVYRISRETGLYSAFDVNTDQLAVLPVGTEVTPADGGSLDCSSLTDSGMTLTLCRVKVPGTGEIGWVLEKWIELR